MKDSILICGLNWFGDSVMSMPAIQAYRRKQGDRRITMLVKPPLAELWRMHAAVDDIIPMEEGVRGVLTAGRRIKNCSFPRVFVFPNSIRAALPPFLGRVPVRRGACGKRRSWLLTDIVAPELARGHAHQAWEYADILGLSAEDCVDPAGDGLWPEIAVPGGAAERAAEMLGTSPDERLVALVPGAARGPSKRWPAEHFTAVGRRLADPAGTRVVLLGTEDEAELCAGIAEGVGSAAVDLAGKTSIPIMAAVLERCKAVLTNDSGGMHLATAVGRPVVAVFGLTDPSKTGPLGQGHKIITREGAQGARDVARDSEEAKECLTSITPDEVYHALAEVLGSE
ncbi:lipopolysaccharide heptosyltransferase II [Verrucomicrobiota bacterium]